tara:strand:- start:293 stop:670 length:378 start_codon:yes stop_codon:yes gene_type:complete
MPKKPTNSIEGFRIELQDKERQILQEAVTAYSVLQYAEAFDKFTSFENLYLLVTMIEIVTGKELLPGTPNDIYKIIDYIRDFNLNVVIPGSDDREYSQTDFVTDQAFSKIPFIGTLLGDIFKAVT